MHRVKMEFFDKNLEKDVWKKIEHAFRVKSELFFDDLTKNNDNLLFLIRTNSTKISRKSLISYDDNVAIKAFTFGFNVKYNISIDINSDNFFVVLFQTEAAQDVLRIIDYYVKQDQNYKFSLRTYCVKSYLDKNTNINLPYLQEQVFDFPDGSSFVVVSRKEDEEYVDVSCVFRGTIYYDINSEEYSISGQE